MQYYNGTDYDTLYPMASYQNMTGTKPSYSFSEISGIVSISQGGTGANNKEEALNNLGGVASSQIDTKIESKLGWQLYYTGYIPTGYFSSYTIKFPEINFRNNNIMISCDSGTLKGRSGMSGSNRYYLECGNMVVISLVVSGSQKEVTNSITEETLCYSYNNIATTGSLSEISFTGDVTDGRFSDVQITTRFKINVYINKK